MNPRRLGPDPSSVSADPLSKPGNPWLASFMGVPWVSFIAPATRRTMLRGVGSTLHRRSHQFENFLTGRLPLAWIPIDPLFSPAS